MHTSLHLLWIPTTCLVLCVLFKVMKIRKGFIKTGWSCKIVPANQNGECGWRALLSAACPVTGLNSDLSSVVSPIPGCCEETKALFTLTLTHRHPHHHRNRWGGIHPWLSDINLSMPGTGCCVKRWKMHIIWCSDSKKYEKRNSISHAVNNIVLSGAKNCWVFFYLPRETWMNLK